MLGFMKIHSQEANEKAEEIDAKAEEEFNIEIPDDVQENIRSVGDAVSHIKAHVA